jgi:hypothetical protein
MEKPPSPTDGEVSGGNITQDKSFGTGWCYHPRTKGRRQLLWLGNRGGWWGRGGGRGASAAIARHVIQILWSRSKIQS